MKIVIVGLGFVGLSFASVLGSKGYHVIGIDSDTLKASKIVSGEPPFYEPGLERVLKSALKKSLRISTSIDLAVQHADLIFVTVGTPQSKEGHIDLTMMRQAVKDIGTALTKTKNRLIIIIKSTITPETTQKIIKPILESQSKKKAKSGFGLITNPEFLREGKAIEDTLQPHIVVIGGDDVFAVSKVKKFYRRLYGSKAQIITTNHQTAELIKYANNSFLATKISFINQIANVCQSIPGTNIEDVARAIGLDPRIGHLFLKAGPGYGGSCLPKDLEAMIRFSSKIGTDPVLLKAVQQTNELQVTRLISLIREFLGNIKGKKITILGLSFKEDSDDIRGSVSIKLIKLLLKNHTIVTVHDPKAIENTKTVFKDKILYANSIREALKDSQCVVIMTPWNQYGMLSNDDFQQMKRKIVIDTRRILNYKNLNIEYNAIGIGK